MKTLSEIEEDLLFKEERIAFWEKYSAILPKEFKMKCNGGDCYELQQI